MYQRKSYALNQSAQMWDNIRGRCLFGTFFADAYNEDKICDFLFALSHTKTLL